MNNPALRMQNGWMMWGLFFIREILDITGISIRETGKPGIGARFEMTVPKGAWRMAGKKEKMFF